MLRKQIKVWSIAINEEEATLEDCPPELIRILMPARSSQKNPLRNPTPKNVKKRPILRSPFIQLPILVTFINLSRHFDTIPIPLNIIRQPIINIQNALRLLHCATEPNYKHLHPFASNLIQPQIN